MDKTTDNRPTRTKISAIESQLAAAAYLHIKGLSPEAVHTLVGAVRGLLYGLHDRENNSILDIWDEALSTQFGLGSKRDLRQFQNELANFLKHSDRDPDSKLEGVDLNIINNVEIFIYCVACFALRGRLSSSLVIALVYCSVIDENAFVFRNIVKTIVGATQEVDDLLGAPLEMRRQACQISIEKFMLLGA